MMTTPTPIPALAPPDRPEAAAVLDEVTVTVGGVLGGGVVPGEADVEKRERSEVWYWTCTANALAPWLAAALAAGEAMIVDHSYLSSRGVQADYGVQVRQKHARAKVRGKPGQCRQGLTRVSTRRLLAAFTEWIQVGLPRTACNDGVSPVHSRIAPSDIALDNSIRKRAHNGFNTTIPRDIFPGKNKTTWSLPILVDSKMKQTLADLRTRARLACHKSEFKHSDGGVNVVVSGTDDMAVEMCITVRGGGGRSCRSRRLDPTSRARFCFR